MGVECVKKLGRIRNHFSHEIRVHTRKLLEGADKTDRDNTLLQDLFNATERGLEHNDGYLAAMPIFAIVALYKSSPSSQRSHDKNGNMTPFACKLLHGKLVQELVSVSEEAFALLCIRKEIIRGLNKNKQHHELRTNVTNKFLLHDKCCFEGEVQDLLVHAKDGFRTEEISLYMKLRQMLKTQRQTEEQSSPADKISRFDYPTSHSQVPSSTSKKRRFDNAVTNAIEVDTEDDSDYD